MEGHRKDPKLADPNPYQKVATMAGMVERSGADLANRGKQWQAENVAQDFQDHMTKEREQPRCLSFPPLIPFP